MNKTPLYKDIDMSLTPHPLTGDIGVKTNLDAVKKSVIHILMLESGDVPFKPNRHSQIMNRLFDLPTVTVITTLHKDIEWAIKSMEPRIEIKRLDISVSDDESGYSIDLEYLIKSLYITDKINYFFKRVR